MSMLHTLAARRSIKADQLTAPAPTGQILADILQSAMSAPDHGGIKPWHFLVIEGEGREKLGDLFAKVLTDLKPDATAEEQAVARGKALRAPLVVAICARTKPHPKVPEIEQILTVAMGAENILLAAQSLGYGAVLLTGGPAYHPIVKQGLGLGDGDHIVGFLHMGTAKEEPMRKDRPNAADFTQSWPG